MPDPELPTTTFDDTKMVVANRSIIVFTPAVGDPVQLLVDYISHAGAVDVGTAMGLGVDGVAFPAKSWARASDDVFRFRCREIKKLISSFSSLAFFAKGSVQLFIRDPEDATGKVALLSEDFDCSIFRDPTEAEMSPANPTEVTIVVQALTDEPVDFTIDAAVT